MSKLDDLRTFALAAPYLMPMIARRKASAIKKLVQAYRGDANLHGVAAEITVLDDLENELKQKHNELTTLQGE